jgi:hypothetical protein
MQNQSEVAQIRQRILQEYEAAQRGLSGFATGTARHDFITARMENLGDLHAELVKLVGQDEATAIIANTVWTPQDQQTML